MLKLLKWLCLGAIGLFALTFTYLHFKYPIYAWHQKMTVTVETPDGLKSGSAVTSIWWDEGYLKGPLSGIGWDYEFRGEAVVVDLGEGRYLFALLRGPGGSEYIGSLFAASISESKRRTIDGVLFDEIENRRDRAASVIEVPDYQYPWLVTFNDTTDSTSVTKVDPANLTASFGDGYSLKFVTLEVTREPVTKGNVEDLLAWLPNANFIIPPVQQPRFVKDQTIEQRLRPSDFIDRRTLRKIRESE